MEIIIHRVNKIKDLKKIPKNFGVEIDIRTSGSKLILNHDPFIKGDLFENYLENYSHKTLVLNLKEAGIEKNILNLVKKYSIKSIDKLQIDVEGAEYEILKSIDFKTIEIKSIQFESKHFDGTFKEGPKLDEIKQKLKSQGYNLNQIDNENIIANRWLSII